MGLPGENKNLWTSEARLKLQLSLAYAKYVDLLANPSP